MKKIKIILLCVVVFFVLLLLGLFIYIKNFDVNQFRPQIMARLSDNLGHDVDIGEMKMELSLDKGISLNVNDFVIKNNPRFSHEDMLLVESIILNVDAMPLIKDRKLVINHIKVFDPTIRLIRTSNGENNFSNFTQTQDLSSGSNISSHSESAIPVNMDFNVQELSIEGGTFIFADRHEGNGAQIIVFHHIDFNLQGFKLAQPVPFSMSAGVFNEKQNVHAQGTLFINPLSQSFELNNVRADFNLKSIDVESLVDSFPVLAEAGVGSELEGEVFVNVNRLAVSEEHQPDINIDVLLTSGRINLRVLKDSIDDLKVNAVIDRERINLDTIHMKLLSGRLDGNLIIDDYLNRGKLKGKIKTRGINVRSLLSGADLPVELEGVAGADIHFGIPLTPEFHPRNMTGGVSAYIDQARVEDVNVLEEILSTLSFVPDLSEKVYDRLSSKYKQKLTVKGTEFTNVVLNGTLKSGTMQYVFKAEADEFLATATGDIDLNLNLNNQMFVRIPEELSVSFVQSVEELRLLLNDKGQINIPFKPYTGPAEEVRFEPHIKKVGQKVIQQKGKEELRKVIFKALDIEDDKQNVDPEQPSQKPKKSDEQQLIEGILNEIPLFK